MLTAKTYGNVLQLTELQRAIMNELCSNKPFRGWGFPVRTDINKTVLLQKQAKRLKLRIHISKKAAFQTKIMERKKNKGTGFIISF